jgi:copper chaperone CopZ
MPDLRTRTFELKGLLPGPFYCAECAQRMCSDASRLPGVTESSCDVDEGTFSVTFDPSQLGETDLEIQVVRLGAEATGSAGHAAYRLTGLD